MACSATWILLTFFKSPNLQMQTLALKKSYHFGAKKNQVQDQHVRQVVHQVV